MKLSPILLLVIGAVVIFAIGLGLSGLIKAPAPNEEEAVGPSEEQEQPEFVPPASACGNGVCDAGERCDEETSRTVCFEDCGYTCPAKLVISSQTGATETQLNSYYCGSGECRQTDENDFIVTGDATISTKIINIGERGSDRVSSSFACDLISNTTAKKANFDGEEAFGVVFRDYFTNELEDVSSIKSRQVGNNSVEYSLDFGFTSQAQNGEYACLLSVRSTGLLNQQTLVVNIAPTA